MNPRDISLRSAVVDIRSLQEELPPDARVRLWREIREGYCQDCGYKLAPGQVCHCENDD